MKEKIMKAMSKVTEFASSHKTEIVGLATILGCGGAAYKIGHMRGYEQGRTDTITDLCKKNDVLHF